MANARLLVDDHVRSYLIEQFSTGTRKKVKFDFDIRGTTIEDSGEPYAPDTYPRVGDFLAQHVTLSATHSDVVRQQLLDPVVIGVQLSAPVINDALTKLYSVPLKKFLPPAPPGLALRERQVRAKLRRLGYTLRKSRRRDPRHPQYACFDVLDARTKDLIFLPIMGLDGIEAWADLQH